MKDEERNKTAGKRENVTLIYLFLKQSLLWRPYKTNYTKNSQRKK